MDQLTENSEFSVMTGLERFDGSLPNLALGVRQGRVWALRLQVWSEGYPQIPKRAPTPAELVGVGLSVLAWAARKAWAQATSDLRARWRRIGRRGPTRRPQA